MGPYQCVVWIVIVFIYNYCPYFFFWFSLFSPHPSSQLLRYKLQSSFIKTWILYSKLSLLYILGPLFLFLVSVVCSAHLHCEFPFLHWIILIACTHTPASPIIKQTWLWHHPPKCQSPIHRELLNSLPCLLLSLPYFLIPLLSSLCHCSLQVHQKPLRLAIKVHRLSFMWDVASQKPLP